MKLIGMLDSPYVRRVAISAKCLGIPLEHASVSVFRHFEQFQQINPVVKAPTLVLDDGEVLMDSTLIIDYLEALAAPGKKPDIRQSGSTLALAAADRPGIGGVREVGTALLRTQPAASGDSVRALGETGRRTIGGSVFGAGAGAGKAAAEDRWLDCSGWD